MLFYPRMSKNIGFRKEVVNALLQYGAWTFQSYNPDFSSTKQNTDAPPYLSACRVAWHTLDRHPSLGSSMHCVFLQSFVESRRPFIEFCRCGPSVAPIFALVIWNSGRYRLKHVLSKVDPRWRFLCSIPLEIVDEMARILARRSMIDDSTSRFEKQKFIKILKSTEVGWWMVTSRA